MSSNNHHPATLQSLLYSAWHNRELILKMTYREIIGRYKGSMIGLAWSFFNPLLMLMVYTFVFSIVFNAKWGADLGGGKGEFAVILFAGMIVFNVFAECVNRAPGLMMANTNYVKKIIFPLEVIPWVVLLNALFHALISFLILLIAQLLIIGTIPSTILVLPVVLLPFAACLMGVTWILAAAGVYLRDLGQLMGIITTVLMFTSPLFFPLSALPESLQPYLALNPLAYFIEEARAVIIFGNIPSLASLVTTSLLGVVVLFVGYAFFQKTRKGFADVL
ncbi:ABC transporter permease [Vibrio hannami]|uniref:ABC transporter permease n=1 Tax=Vibrio hannami TaxID=2717094 RepID=UPI00240FB593|nr:ABC transporter permease [Vibrio hannami]MDG3086926.1 ABC transporter permease [Vibrio hannami]